MYRFVYVGYLDRIDCSIAQSTRIRRYDSNLYFRRLFIIERFSSSQYASCIDSETRLDNIVSNLVRIWVYGYYSSDNALLAVFRNRKRIVRFQYWRFIYIADIDNDFGCIFEYAICYKY